MTELIQSMSPLALWLWAWCMPLGLVLAGLRTPVERRAAVVVVLSDEYKRMKLEG